MGPVQGLGAPRLGSNPRRARVVTPRAITDGRGVIHAPPAVCASRFAVSPVRQLGHQRGPTSGVISGDLTSAEIVARPSVALPKTSSAKMRDVIARRGE